MYRKIVTAFVVLFASAVILSAQETSSNAAPLSEEALAWEAVKGSEASADVFAFIQRYPDGEFGKEAKARMIDLLWTEMAADGPTPAPESSVDINSVSVAYSTPLTVGAPEITGKTIEKLIEGTPLFPPVEGLPEAYWKTQKCSNCHEWKRENLCAQANTYLSDAGAENLTKQHPYGGTFKLNLRNWAKSGCE